MKPAQIVGRFRPVCARAFAGIVLLSLSLLAEAQTLAPGVTLVPVGQGYALLNCASFSRANLTTVGNTQYVAFYGLGTNVVLGKRALGTSIWTTNHTSFKPNSATDGHDIISIGMASDGILHCSWGMHGDTFHYARGTQAWSLNLVATNMTGNENAVTYPQFLNTPDGDLLYLFREGTSGAGDTCLNRYSSVTHAWTNVHTTSGAQSPFIKGTTGNAATDCNAYPNFAGFDSQANLILTWTWRENAASIDYNHDTLYARSPDYGATWLRSDGATYTLPILKSTADNVYPIPQNMQLMNQCGQGIDTNDRPVIATWWAPGGSGTPIQIFLVSYTGTAWVTNQVGTRTTTTWPTRPICLIDKSNRVMLVFSDAERGNVPTLAYTTGTNRAAWNFANLTSEDLGSWEATYDPVVWQRDGKLHMFYQRIDGASGGRPISVLEFDSGVFFSNAPQPNLVLDWAGNSGNWSVGGNWSGATPPPAGGTNNLTLQFGGATSYNATNNLPGSLALNVLQLAGTAAVTNTTRGNPLAFVSNGGAAPALNQSGTAAFQVSNNLTITNTLGVLCGGVGLLTVDGTISGDGALSVSGAGTLELAGTNTFTGGLTLNSGTLRIASAAALGASPPVFVNNQFTLGSATLQAKASASLNDANTGVFVSGSGVVQVDTNVAFTIANAISGTGTLTKRDPGTLILAGSNSLSGTLNLDRGIDGNNNDGATRITTPAAVAGFSSLAIRNTSVSTAGGATLQLDGSAGGMVLGQNLAVSCRNNTNVATVQNLSGTNTLAGSIYVNTGGQHVNFRAEANSQLTLSGPIQYIGSLIGGRIYNFFGDGGVIVSGPILRSANNAPVSVVKYGLGTLTLAGANTYTNTTTVYNGTLLVNGSIVSPGQLAVVGGTLGGTGTVSGPVTVQSGATLAPGAGIGPLTVSNSVTLEAGSTTRIELNKSAGTNDRLRVVGTLTCGGTLVVTNLGGTLWAGDSFRILDATTTGGYFAATNLPALPDGFNWQWTPASGTLSITSTVALNPTNITASLSGATLQLSWPADHIGWRVETNAVDIADANAWFTLPGSATTNRMFLPADATAPNVFFRLVYP